MKLDGFAHSLTGEGEFIGGFPTVEDARKDGQEYYECEKSFYIGECVAQSCAPYVDIYRMLEMAAERAFDDLREGARDWPDITPEQAEPLKGVIVAWLDENVPMPDAIKLVSHVKMN